MYNILTLKHGTKYSAEYVNKMYNMIHRHVTMPYNFYCFTEDSSGLNPNINIRPLPAEFPISGWWYKTYLFRKEHFTSGINFYIDLDMVITKNIDEFLTYDVPFMGTRNVMYLNKPKVNSLGSCILKWPAGKYHDIWDTIEREPKRTLKYLGDQDYIYERYPSIQYCPDHWLASYKWSPDLTQAKIVAFHGIPRPHDVHDPFILENWI
jgi:hypothetical protein